MIKNTYLYVLSTFVFAFCTQNANASSQHLYANGISAHNIATIQHSVMNTVMNSFAGSAAGAIDTPRIAIPKHVSETIDDTIYGHPTMYGEYNDDGSIQFARGRSGGDSDISERPSVSNMWLNWQHYNQDARFNDMSDLDSDFDTITAGISGADTQFKLGISKWGVYAGYTAGTQDNKNIHIDEHGGYFGLYGGFDFGNLEIAASVNSGALTNTAEYGYHSDEYVNLWTGGAINAQYNIALDNTFTLQPGLYTGYTWIRSADYTSATNQHIANQNFNMFEITPALRAIKSLGNGWFGHIGAKYVFNIVGGGDVTVDNIAMADLDIDDYSEYGIGIEKSIDRFYISANLNRRDGGISGWFGGINLKYLF